MNGKGDGYRKVDRNKWDSNWDRIFGGGSDKQERIKENALEESSNIDSDSDNDFENDSGESNENGSNEKETKDNGQPRKHV